MRASFAPFGIVSSVKRWLPWLVLPAALSALVVLGRSSSPDLLKDTDTAALLARIRVVDDPTAWFTGDWPLQNHFYRPISTLTFEWDDRRSAGNPAAFGLTNALLAAACILLLFWLLRETTDLPWLSGASATLFGVWHLGAAHVLPVQIALLWLAPLCLLGVLRGGKEKLLPCIYAALACLFLASQLLPVEQFAGRIVDWLPGRTASVMAVFALVSMAAYARYVRLAGNGVVFKASVEDVPVSKHAPAAVEPSRWAWLWVVVSIVALVLALGSYEQAVTLPGALAGVAILLAVQGRRSAWWPHACFWLVLVGYFVLRAQLLPAGTSGYQVQQLRSGQGMWFVLGNYLLPGVLILYTSVFTFTGALLLITGTFWIPVLTAFGNFTTYWRTWKDRRLRWTALGFLCLSAATFMPMAWLKHFGHYHYWPSALRAPFVVLLAVVVFRLVASAASLPALRAPSRPSPAPGSLLRQ